MNTRTRIWKRTRVYFSLMIALYLATAAVLIMTVGRDKVSREYLLENTAKRTAREAQRLEALRGRLASGGVSAKVIDAALAEDLKRIASERELVQRIRANERKPKNAKNEKEIGRALQADYARLRALNAGDGDAPSESPGDRLHWKMLLVVTIFLAGMGVIMFVLIFLILVPLEKIIGGIRRVTSGDLLVDFDVRTADEMTELAEVLKDLTTNFRELLVLIRNSYDSGMEIHRDLQDANAETREKALGELENLCLRLRELTEYFQFRRS